MVFKLMKATTFLHCFSSVPALLWFHYCWSQNTGSRWVWIFTLRGWIQKRLSDTPTKTDWTQSSWKLSDQITHEALQNGRKTEQWKTTRTHAQKPRVYSCVWPKYLCKTSQKKYIVACKTVSCFLPDRFIQRGEETQAVLQRLVSHGKKLFLITNSPFGFV